MLYVHWRSLILNNNCMINCYREIARYSESVEPVFCGYRRHGISTISVNIADKLIKRKKENKSLEKKCQFCNAREGIIGHKFLFCGCCKLVSYCSPVCQKENWKVHKPAFLKNKEFLDLLVSRSRQVVPTKLKIWKWNISWYQCIRIVMNKQGTFT